jgi:hypothetical protein
MDAKAIKTAVRAVERRVRDAVTALQAATPCPGAEPVPVLVEERCLR